MFSLENLERFSEVSLCLSQRLAGLLIPYKSPRNHLNSHSKHSMERPVCRQLVDVQRSAMKHPPSNWSGGNSRTRGLTISQTNRKPDQTESVSSSGPRPPSDLISKEFQLTLSKHNAAALSHPCHSHGQSHCPETIPHRPTSPGSTDVSSPWKNYTALSSATWPLMSRHLPPQEGPKPGNKAMEATVLQKTFERYGDCLQGERMARLQRS